MKIADAWAAFEAQDYATAEQIATSLLENPNSTTDAYFLLGYVHAFSGKFSKARTIFQQLRQKGRQLGDLEAEHRALHQIGMVERMAGNWEAARLCFLEERNLIAQLPDNVLAISVNAYEVATIALHFGELDTARQEYTNCLLSAEKSGDRVAVACAFRGLGDLTKRENDDPQAQNHWLAARKIFEDLEDLQGVKELDERLEQIS